MRQRTSDAHPPRKTASHSQKFHLTCFFSLLSKVSFFSNWRTLFDKVLYKRGAQYLKHLFVKLEQGNLCSTSFHVSGLLRKLVVDVSLSSNTSFKYSSSLHLLALWDSKHFFHLFKKTKPFYHFNSQEHFSDHRYFYRVKSWTWLSYWALRSLK